ncbi:MAG TPA: glycosyltransferase [Ilumatobacteraceae bacterium]|nr:glycosyltransferase [Ilumatobacteraceae bacterium]
MQERAPLLYACDFDNGGYAVAARRYLRALHAVREPVEWLPLINTYHGHVPTDDWATAPREQKALVTNATGHEALLAHSMPEGWAHIRAERGPQRMIGQTVWEADRIPQRWHSELAAADEIWVPTQWNADAFRRSGISVPIHIVPHAIDTQLATASPMTPLRDRFTFLTISTWDWRKRPDLALHAYLRAFTDADPVTLVIKTGQRVLSWRCAHPIELHTWWQVMSIVRQYPKAADVVLITDDQTDAEMAEMTRRADCYVSLTCVEGWGLGAFDAAVAGVPVIITGYGGQMEWLGSGHTGLVPFEMVPADHPDTSMFEPAMTWALPDIDAAASMMRAAVFDTPTFVVEAPALAARLRIAYSETAVGALMKAALR